jgi:Alcohol dehydrogenase GroES-like domain
MPSFALPMPQSVGLIYGPTEGWNPFHQGRLGHEWMGMVEDVGSQVSTIKRGDRVIAPFAFSEGTCEFCHKGLAEEATHRRFGPPERRCASQGQAARVPGGCCRQVERTGPRAPRCLPERHPRQSGGQGLLRAASKLAGIIEKSSETIGSVTARFTKSSQA